MGRKTTDAELQKVYDEFWRHIIEPNGVVDFEQVKKELYDFHNVIQEVTKVYPHITNNEFSKPLTSAEAVIDATEAHYKWWYSEGGEDAEWGRQSRLDDPVWEMEKKAEKLRNLPPGQPCGPGCANHVTHPCEKCGRYRAGLAGGPPETAAGEVSSPFMSMPWETQEGWEKEVAQSVVFSNMAPREAKEILDLVGVSLGQPGYTVKLILKAIKATPHLQDLIRVAELVEVAGDTDIVCPFCAVVGDREHLSDCLVTRSRMVLARVKAAMA